jgi:YD repeat-containing protein
MPSPIQDGESGASIRTKLNQAFLDLDPSTNSVTYANGRVTAYVSNGVSTTVQYDGQGRVTSTTTAGVVKTVAYNADGTVASYA